MIRIAPETAADGWEIEYLLDLAFAPGRTALSSYRLRDGVAPVAPLCLTARDDDAMAALAGCIRFWPVRVGDAGTALLLGPVATHPTRQGEGIGAMLILDGLERAVAEGWGACILVGDAPYYRRFGFERADALRFPPPTNPNRVLARALVPGGLEGMAGPVSRWTDAREPALDRTRPHGE